MAQIPKIVDLTKGYVFTDPKAFADNRGHTQQQDAPVEILPVVAMEGYNFMPTAYGYRSYFGTNSTLDIAALGARVDFLIMMQMSNFKNVAIALCEDGIWWAQPTISGAVWAQAASYPIPTAGTHKDWTYALLENTLYCYLQGSPEVWKLSYMDFVDAPFSITFSKEVPSTFINYATLAAMNADTTITSDKVGKLCYNYETSLYYHLDSIAPTWAVYSSTAHGNFILNMAGQLGIFRANLRLAFWDSTNSIGWSDLYDKMDFEPSLETRAGNTIFSGILGRIVSILPQDTGFVIYSTKNIIGVRFANDVAQIWDASVVHDSAGIAYPRQVTVGASDSDQFAYTNIGFLAIGKFNPLTHKNEMSVIMPDVYDILKESGDPVYLDFMQGRYLFISVVDPRYITGAIRISFESAPDIYVRVLVNDARWDGLTILPVYIGEKSVEVDLANQIAQGVYEGMYTRWTVTGNSTVPTRITPINPYTLDVFATHTPNPLPLDDSSLLSAEDVSNLVAGTTINLPSFNTAYPYAAELGWTFPGLGVTSSAYLGNTDAFLDTFQAVQGEEWGYLSTVLGNTAQAISAATPLVEAPILGTTAYTTDAIAQNIIDNLVLSHGGTGNSYTVSDELLGEVLSGVSDATISSYTGVGTYHAGFSMSKRFHGGYSVRRLRTRTYSKRTGVSINYATRLIIRIRNPDPTHYETIYYTIPAYGSPDINEMNNRIYSDYIAEGCTWQGFGGWYNIGTFCEYMTGNVQYYSDEVEHFVDSVDTISLYLVPNAGVEYIGEALANQTVLDWAYVPDDLGKFQYTDGAILVSGVDLAASSALPPFLGVTYPGATFLLQDGSIAPIYPTFTGALVLDTHLKKLGKLKADYKSLIEYSPINSNTNSLSFTNFGVTGGLVDVNGVLTVFDALPLDSYIKYGLYGLYRLGYTNIEEVKVSQRFPLSYSVKTSSSDNGRDEAFMRYNLENYTNSNISVQYCGLSGRWHTVKISGNYDLTGLEIRGTISGRR